MSETTAETTVETTETVTEEVKPTETVEFWKQKSRENEKRAKANADAAKKLAELEESTKSETQKAIDAAKVEADKAARADVAREFGKRLAAAEVKAALTGVVKDPAAIVEELNLDRYVTDDGEVDVEAVKGLRAKYEAEVAPGKPRGSVDQGPRGDALALNGDPLLDTVTNLLGNR